MAQPTPYVRQYDFVDWQTDNPSDPLPASPMEQEFDAIKTTLDETLANLALIQRDDGVLANNSVGPQQLNAATLAMLGLEAANIRGAWITARAYAVNDVVTQNNSTYICAIAHTSGTFSTDLAAVRWVLLAAFVDPLVTLPPGSVGTTELADNAVTNAKMADNSVGTAELIDNGVTAAKLAANSVVTAKIADGAVATAKLADLGVTTAKLADLSVTTAKMADASVTWGKLAAGVFNQTAVAPATGDKLVFSDASDSGNTKVATVADILALVTIPPSSGEANTGSNLGTGGANVFESKVGVDLRFRQIKVVKSGTRPSGGVAVISDLTFTVTQNANDVTITITPTWSDVGGGGGGGGS